MWHKLKSPRENLEGAIQHPHVLVNLNRVVGTYNTSQLSFIHISRTGVSPKSHQCDNEWKLIIDLSYTKNQWDIQALLNSPLCVHSLEPLEETCKDIGVPLAMEELEGPTISPTFLKLVLDPANISLSWRIHQDVFRCLR